LRFVRPNDEITRLVSSLEQYSLPDDSADRSLSTAPSVVGDSDEPVRLAQLRRLAEATRGERREPDKTASAVSDVLRRVHVHLKALAETLDLLKPAYPPRSYVIPGVPSFCNLVWTDGRVGYNTTTASSGEGPWTGVWFRYLLSANTLLRVVRDYPASERLRQTLTENQIDYTTLDERNERGAVVRSVFDVSCAVTASVAFDAAPNGRDIVLTMRNVDGFGIVKDILTPEQIDNVALDRLVAHVLAEARGMPLLEPVRSR